MPWLQSGHRLHPEGNRTAASEEGRTLKRPAADHIARFGTKHTEAIVTENKENASRFIALSDCAAVMVNTSTRFTDGEQMGFGAEIGISNQKLHARGPMGLEAMTTTTWIVTGNGQIRS